MNQRDQESMELFQELAEAACKVILCSAIAVGAISSACRPQEVVRPEPEETKVDLFEGPKAEDHGRDHVEGDEESLPEDGGR